MLDTEARQLRTLSWTLHAAGVIPTVGIVLLIWFAYVVPTATAIRALRAESARTAKQLSMGTVVRREHRELEQQLHTNRDKITLVRQRMPDNAGEDAFLQLIAEASAKSGVRIKHFSRGKEERRPEFSELDIHIQAHGSFAGICRFLDYLRHVPRVARIVALQVSGQDRGDYPLDLTVRLYYDVRVPTSAKRGTQHG